MFEWPKWNVFFKKLFNPPENLDLKKAEQVLHDHLPTIWLLGKTGSGKSSLIKSITNQSSVEIGNGFQPCTMTSQIYEFPAEKPLFRFLDTRGISEADYDPHEDIEQASQSSFALIVVIKLDDVEQSDVLQALKSIKNAKKIQNILVVYTSFLALSDSERASVVRLNNKKIADIWKRDVSYVEVDFESGSDSDAEYFYGQETLQQKLALFLPSIAILMESHLHSTQESRNFDQLRTEVLWFSSAASASDLIPVAGLVSVPAIQGKMLHNIANQYGVEWNKRLIMDMFGALGTTFTVNYSLSLGSRQLAKLIPVYGQTAGAALSAVISFASTYAIGRTAAYYFYKKQQNQPFSKEELKDIYSAAFKQAKATKNEKS